MTHSAQSIQDRPSSIPMRLMSGVLVLTMTFLGGCPAAPGLRPQAGNLDYQDPGRIPFRYGDVNAIGGNLNVKRIDLSIDTLIGTVEIGATYNSATKSWTWSFDENYQSGIFTDASGARHDGIDALAEGEALAGTTWVKSTPLRIKTKAGLVHHFHGITGNLRWMYWGDAAGVPDYPRLVFAESQTAHPGPRVTSVSQCRYIASCAHLYSIFYNSSGNLEWIEDHTGRRAEFTWNGSRLVRARDGLDVAEGRPGWTYAYSYSGLLTAITNSEGERTEISYASGRVATIRDIGENNPTKTFFYEGEVDGYYATRYWDELGTEHIYAYDGLRQLARIENVALGEIRSWVYGSGLRPTSVTDETQLTTYYSWSGDDLIAEIRPSGNNIQYTYQPTGINQANEVTKLFEDDFANPGHRPFLRVEDGRGVIEERTYDAEGMLVSVTRGDGSEAETHTFTYKDGQIDLIGAPSGADQCLDDYGWHGHPEKIRRFFGPNLLDTRSFDAVGNFTAGKRLGELADGGVVSRTYDADRNERILLLEDGGTIAIDVRSDGQRTRIQRPGGDDHEMDYDALGRMTARRERVDGYWQATAFEFDAKGRRTAAHKPNGMRQELQYDAADRITNLTNLRNDVPESWSSTTFTNGRMSSRFDSVQGGTEYYYYDFAGRLALRTHFEGTHTAHSYDTRSRKLSEQYLDSSMGNVRLLTYGYDSLDRETTIADGQLPLITRTIADGQLTGIAYGNGLTRTFGYTNGGDLESARTIGVHGLPIEETSINTGYANESGTLDFRIDVSTQTLNTLTNATTRESYILAPIAGSGSLGFNRARVIGWGDEFGWSAPITSLAYDGKSNLLSEEAATFNYNAEGNRLLSITEPGQPTLSYAYDEAGYVTQRGAKAITWTANGRIASHGADQFEWDAIGNPVSATVDGATAIWLFASEVIGSAPGVPTAIVRDEFRLDLATDERLYRHYDFRNNVKFASNQLGEIFAHYHYSAYGLEAVYGADEDEVRFVGRRAVGDLMMLGARAYDPTAGRFLSADPIFHTVNQYSYTLGNPVWWWDPDGETAAAVALAAGVIGLGLGVVAYYTDNTAAEIGGLVLGAIGIALAAFAAFVW